MIQETMWYERLQSYQDTMETATGFTVTVHFRHAADRRPFISDSLPIDVYSDVLDAIDIMLAGGEPLKIWHRHSRIIASFQKESVQHVEITFQVPPTKTLL